MSLKSKPLILEGTFTEVKEEAKEIPKSAIVLQKPNCWCVGRNYKLHQVGDPFCHFSGTYKPPAISSMTDFPVCSIGLTNSSEGATRSFAATPVTFDEDLLTSCINRAVMKTPSEFVSLLDEGRVNPSQARLINNELRAMGYCITEEPF